MVHDVEVIAFEFQTTLGVDPECGVERYIEMSKYAELARNAATAIRNGTPVIDAWNLSAHRVFPNQPASRDKGCPKNAFLGLAEEGLIKGVPRGDYTRSQLNKEYALKALSIMRKHPEFADDPEELWKSVMQGTEKKHNQQMNVVTGLWNNGDLV